MRRRFRLVLTICGLIAALAVGYALGIWRASLDDSPFDVIQALRRYTTGSSDDREEVAVQFANSLPATRQLIGVLGAGAQLQPASPMELRRAALEVMDKTTIVRDLILATKTSAYFDPEPSVSELAHAQLEAYRQWALPITEGDD